MTVMNETLEIHVLNAVAEIPAAVWDACAGLDNPFVSHGFLAALEDSGSVTRKTGWMPRHLAVKRDGAVLGVMPLYLKTHSFGEYVFDWAWAEWFHRHGGQYYPKLQGCVPFSPVTGPRLLVPDGPDQDQVRRALAQGVIAVAERLGVSSVHITFPTEPEAEVLRHGGFMLRQGFQFHWTDPGYGSFDGFLNALSSRKRKQIRKERAAISGSGLTLTTLVGCDIKPHHWDHFYRFYCATTDAKMGETYLSRSFFDLLSQSAVGSKVVLMLALDGGTPIAGAFNMMGADTLYGRNWGCTREVPFLHFETCYYQALEFALANGLTRVEAGAQGGHKLDRGYLAAPTWSAHWIADPHFTQAVKNFLVVETDAIAHEIAKLNEMGPFKKADE